MNLLAVSLLALGQLPPPAELPPAPPPAVVVPGRPPTHQEFAAAFVPAPGVYQVVLLHPKTGRPVPVAFTLPPGAPKVKVGKRFLEFDYGKHEVEILFRLSGRVDVNYD